MRRVGEAWLLGCVVAAFLLVVFPWSRITVLTALAITLLGKWWRSHRSPIGWHNLLDLLTASLVGGYIRFATIAPPVEFDYLSIWGLKAREFWLAGGINTAFLQQTHQPNIHADYPLLVPLIYDAQALLLGRWDDQEIGLITAAFGVAALLVVRGLLAEELSPWARAFATLLLMPLVFSPFLGLAEGPLIAYSVVGLLYVRRAMKQDDAASALRGAVYLGCAASCKDEGLMLIVAVALGLLVGGAKRLLPRLWPAVVIPLPWLVWRQLLDLTPLHLQTGIIDRLLARLADPMPVFQALVQHPPGQALFWLGFVAACVIGWRRVRSEHLLATVCALQPLFFIGTYFLTPRELDWHVRLSWSRVLRQTMPVMALLAVFALAVMVEALFRREREAV